MKTAYDRYDAIVRAIPPHIKAEGEGFHLPSRKAKPIPKRITTTYSRCKMQNIYKPPFEERITYYASKMVAVQGKAG